VKVDVEKGTELIRALVVELYTIAQMLAPIMPETHVKMLASITTNKKPESPLFLRKD
jgi:hypothetical protein